MTTQTTPSTSQTVDRLLELIAAGRGRDMGELYAADALLDATVPGWRFQKSGPERITEVWSHWFAPVSTFEAVERIPVPGGEVIRYELTGEQEDGRSFAVHHCHMLTVDAESGLIARHRVWCGGRWYADRLEEMAAAQRAEPA